MKKKDRHRKVNTKIWGDAKFLELPAASKLVWLFLCTHPKMTSLGIVRETFDVLAMELDPKKTFSTQKAFTALCSGDIPFAVFDPDMKIIGLLDFAKNNLPESPSVIIGYGKIASELPECKLLGLQLLNMRNAIKENLTGKFISAFDNIFAHEYISYLLNLKAQTAQPEIQKLVKKFMSCGCNDLQKTANFNETDCQTVQISEKMPILHQRPKIYINSLREDIKYSDHIKGEGIRWGVLRGEEKGEGCTDTTEHKIVDSRTTETSSQAFCSSAPRPKIKQKIKPPRHIIPPEVKIVFDAWDEMAEKYGLPKAGVRADRISRCKKRLIDKSEILDTRKCWRELWREGLKMFDRCPILQGEGRGDWVPDLDFFLYKISMVKILDGKYLPKSERMRKKKAAQPEIHKRENDNGEIF